jgi:anti-sigma regulatory factor (Ser/Thr protein kinase)
MPTASGAHGQRRSSSSLPSPLTPYWRWRRVFPGHQRELSQLRRWLSSLLPECPARDDLLSVATELGSNALEHTASGQDGGWFAVEVTWQPSTVQVAVADCGGTAEPRVISDPDGERGRGLLLVQGLSLRTGWTGDVRGRLVWAQMAWTDQGLAVPDSSEDPYQASVREGEDALARRFAGVPAWFGRSTLAWWAVAGPAGLVSAPTAQDLAALLYRLLDGPEPAQPPPAGQADCSSVSEPLAPQPRRQLGSRRSTQWRSPGTAGTGSDGDRHGRPARNRRPAIAPGLAAAGAA